MGMSLMMKLVLFSSAILLSSFATCLGDSADERLMNPFLEELNGTQTCPKDGDCWYPPRYDFIRTGRCLFRCSQRRLCGLQRTATQRAGPQGSRDDSMDHLYELWGLTGWTPGLPPLYPNLTTEFWNIYNSPSGTIQHTFLSWWFDVLKNYVYPRDEQEKAFVTAKLAKLRSQVNELLGKDGVLLLPAWPTPPPFHHMEPFVAFNLLYTQMFNVLGNPAMTVPTGKSVETGMPTGVQLVGASFNEALLIAVGRELEKGFGGWVKPGK